MCLLKPYDSNYYSSKNSRKWFELATSFTHYIVSSTYNIFSVGSYVFRYIYRVRRHYRHCRRLISFPSLFSFDHTEILPHSSHDLLIKLITCSHTTSTVKYGVLSVSFFRACACHTVTTCVSVSVCVHAHISIGHANSSEWMEREKLRDSRKKSRVWVAMIVIRFYLTTGTSWWFVTLTFTQSCIIRDGEREESEREKKHVMKNSSTYNNANNDDTAT